jgi:hypothetical protein
MGVHTLRRASDLIVLMVSLETAEFVDSDGLPPEMVADYLLRCLAAMPALKLAADRSDSEFLRDFGHRLRGTGALYGHPLISTLGSLIQEAAARHDLAEASAHIATLEALLQNLLR